MRTTATDPALVSAAASLRLPRSRAHELLLPLVFITPVLVPDLFVAIIC